MYLNYYLQQLRYIVYMAPVLLIAITAHEFAHGWMSERLGDPTPRADGRMSLNPFRHLDLIGTLCLLFFHMGWAKPVRINTRYPMSGTTIDFPTAVPVDSIKWDTRPGEMSMG